jgi:hypothetical protein
MFSGGQPWTAVTAGRHNVHGSDLLVAVAPAFCDRTTFA